MLKKVFFFVCLRGISIHTLGSAASLVEEHHKIDGHVSDLTVLIGPALVGLHFSIETTKHIGKKVSFYNPLIHQFIKIRWALYIEFIFLIL